MGPRGNLTKRLVFLPGGALALVLATPALAQNANDLNSFSLPPGTPTPAPPVVALPPPAVATPAPAASPSPAPSASASPKPAPSPRATATPAPRPSASPSSSPAPHATPRPGATPLPTAAATPSAAPSALPTSPPAVVPLPTDTAVPAATASAPALAPTPASGTPLWPWLAGGAAVVLGGAAFALSRRRKAGAAEEAEPEAYAEAPAAPAEPEPSPPAALPREPAPSPAIPEPALSLADVPPPPAPPAPEPAPRKAAGQVTVTLAAKRLSATLMNTALTYELTVTNSGEEPIGPIAVSGDMIGAHASIPPKVLLETTADGEPQHRVPRLEPGESAAMSGELRLPLAAITPIRHGPATLFVPLARFRVLVFREGRPPVSANHAFVIGEEPQTPGAALKPFRLDLGPRLYSGITQRELSLPA